MQLALNTDQEQLREAFDKVLRSESTPARVRAAEPLGHDAKLWDGLVAFGVPMMRVPEEAGGLGIGLLDASLIAEVAGACAKDGRGSTVRAGSAAIPISSLRRNADCSPCLVSSDMSHPIFGSRTRYWSDKDCRDCAAHRYARLRILHRKIAT